MKFAPLFVLVGCVLLGHSCSGEAGAATNVGDVADRLTSTLTSITDGPSAERLKDDVASLTEQLRSALSAASDVAKPAGEQVGQAVERGTAALSEGVRSALAKVKDQVARLTANPEIQKALGPVLDKLKSLVGA